MRLEELEISTVIKDQKTALSFVLSVDLIRAHKMRAEACTTSDHLPEFRFRFYLLKEHQVQRFRYVDTGIHHIHGHRDLRILLRISEIIDDRLCVGIVTDDTLNKRPLIVRIELIKALEYKLRVTFVLCKYDRFSDLLSTLDLDATFHQIL